MRVFSTCQSLDKHSDFFVAIHIPFTCIYLELIPNISSCCNHFLDLVNHLTSLISENNRMSIAYNLRNTQHRRGLAFSEAILDALQKIGLDTKTFIIGWHFSGFIRAPVHCSISSIRKHCLIWLRLQR